VQHAIADGRLSRSVERRDGKAPRIVVSVADIEWNENTSPAHARAAPPLGNGHDRFGGADDYRRSLVIKTVVRTKLDQLELERQQGRLIDAAEAVRSQSEIARLVRDHLFEFPDRLADELALESDAHRTREILTREITDLTRKLAARLREGALTQDRAKEVGRANSR
jgi:hypothetical protein